MIQLDFKKQNGLIPCVVQNAETKQVYQHHRNYRNGTGNHDDHDNHRGR